MNILLISQCHKNALKQTRQILDQFAERCGERTWQTAITEQGLMTLHKLLRQQARKNTAVACYQTRGKNHTELLWIVGDKSQFNAQGRVPTNRTERNILRTEDERQWRDAKSIQIVAVLAALLHDLGKATIGFQHKLTAQNRPPADPYRHEWISLKLFQLMIKDCRSNQQVLERLADFATYQQQNPDWYTALRETAKGEFEQLPPLAKWIGWLIVSHHRLPFLSYARNELPTKRCNDLLHLESSSKLNHILSRFSVDDFFKQIKALSGWVINSSITDSKVENIDYWTLKRTVTESQNWLKQLRRWATKGLNCPQLQQFSLDNLSNPFWFYVSRLALMVGDHNYSSQDGNVDPKTQALIANTNKQHQPKQHLDQHLLGVAAFTARFARIVPLLSHELPALKHKKLAEYTKIERFQWQNHAYELAKAYQSEAAAQGFFGVNMASTGCGKTLANCRIVYALNEAEKGARFTIALGLRVLTLQTGRALRERLNLNEEQLAVLVGGSANRKLFDHQQTDNLPQHGSESEESLVDGFVDCAINDKELGTVIENPKARKLLYSPIVSCTIDHLIQASECLRGGKYIAPMLRLLTSDLILDEPDDFDAKDIPALSRLVHLAGLLGSKVLLSSATLTPHQISGLFDAYQQGRRIYAKQQGITDGPILCGWFDEYQQQMHSANGLADFWQIHMQFATERANHLAQEPVRRSGMILEHQDYQDKSGLPIEEENSELNYHILARQLLSQIYQLHQHYHTVDPDTQKQVSIGLIRLALTKDVVALTKALYQQSLPDDTQVHIVVYHARQLLVLRNKLEEKLDRILNRSQEFALFEQPEIKQAIQHSHASQQIFIVVGSPVTEVGRDHDYDWAIVEPSSMRSIIQLVGRVWRHRPAKIAKQPNIVILPSNLRALKNWRNLAENKKVYFYHPGFESEHFKLSSYHGEEIILSEQLANINAIARITLPTFNQLDSTSQTLAELEHRVMAAQFSFAITNQNQATGARSEQASYVSSFWKSGTPHYYHTLLQQLSPFRDNNGRERDYICYVTADHQYHFFFADKAKMYPTHYYESCDTVNSLIDYQSELSWMRDSKIRPWLTLDLHEELWSLEPLLTSCKHLSSEQKLAQLAAEFSTVSLYDAPDWQFHPWIGFYTK